MKTLITIDDWTIKEDKEAYIFHDCEESQSAEASGWGVASQSMTPWVSQSACYWCKAPIPNEIRALYILYTDGI
jgi:hypothetical protein